MRQSIVVLSMAALALVLFALPARFEGPVLVPISPGHGLSLVDMAAVVPLIVAQVVLATSLVRRRAVLEGVIRQRPWPTAAVLVTVGLGLGLLFASVFPFFWWWAVGAALVTVALGLVARASVRGVRGPQFDRQGSRDEG